MYLLSDYCWLTSIVDLLDLNLVYRIDLTRTTTIKFQSYQTKNL